MQLIIYGAGFWGEEAMRHFGAENVYCFCDSRLGEGEETELCGKRVIPFPGLLKIWKDHVIVVSAGVNFNMEISRHLDAAGIEDHMLYPVLLQMGEDADAFMGQLQEDGGRDRAFKRYYRALAQRTEGQLTYLKEHADIMALKPAKGHMREEQRRLLRFAEGFFDDMKDLQIRPFLLFGNLIGAFRHKGFVPWDDDWDFGIMRDELNRLLEFAEENYVVGTRCGDIWKETSGRQIPWEELFRQDPQQYVFDIRPDMVHIYQGVFGGAWRAGMDLWVFDYYKEGYAMSEHRKWLEEIDVGLHGIEDSAAKVAYLKAQREGNPQVSGEETPHIFPGIDAMGGHPGRKDVGEWIRTEDIFPLRKVPYEDTAFWAPKDMEALLRTEYWDYMSFPDDVGIPVHIGMDERE